MGIDFSPPSEAALARAIELAKRTGASLTLMHVYQAPGFALPETIVPAPPDVLQELLAENQVRLASWAARARAAGVSSVSVEQVAGAPHFELVERARQGFDLVVVGTHGRTGITHALLGSVAEKVVRRSPVPVLTVPTHELEQPHHF